MQNSQVLSTEDAFRRALTLQKQGQFSEAEALYRRILEICPDHANTLHFLGILMHRRGESQQASNYVTRSIELKPQEASFYQNYGGIFKERGDYESAVGQFRAALELNPNDIVCLSNLCEVFYRLGREAEAVKVGQRALEQKDQQACKTLLPMKRPAVAPFQALQRERNIIAFSLWGKDPTYIEGALENAWLTPHIYPEWTCRIYCDLSISAAVVSKLQSFGAQVVQFQHESKGYEGLFWRFLAANDKSIDRFICRDADCRLNVKERVAVEEWIISGLPFHIMRDNVIHTELMLAGLWGGVSGALPDIANEARSYLQQYGQRWADQHYLREHIWPLIKPHTLTHDSFYRLGSNSRRFPEYGSLPRPGHVGGAKRIQS